MSNHYAADRGRIFRLRQTADLRRVMIYSVLVVCANVLFWFSLNRWVHN